MATIRRYRKQLKQLTDRQLTEYIEDNWEAMRVLVLHEADDTPSKVVKEFERKLKVLWLIKHKLDAEVQCRPGHQYFVPGLFPLAHYSRTTLVDGGCDVSDVPF